MKLIKKLMIDRLGSRIDDIRGRKDIIHEEEFMEIYEQVKKYTMVSKERLYSLYEAVCHVIANDVEGDFVECGVWKGGACMLIALTLKKLGVENRWIWLFDTFKGMSAPTEHDLKLYAPKSNPKRRHELHQRHDHNDWGYGSIYEVGDNMNKTGYRKFGLIEGKVEDTLPTHQIDKIALLRLDTDFYESTKAELEHLYPKLEWNGVLLLDDYGTWAGSRLAVDKYFMDKPRPLLVRVDHSGRTGIKNQE